MDYITPHYTRAAANKLKVLSSNMILRGDSKLASAALEVARHVGTTGLRGGSEKVEVVLKVLDFVESGCQSPLVCPTNMNSGRDFQNAGLYSESLVMLARNVDAHPWGAFGFVHPDKYLPFLLQLAGDLMDQEEQEAEQRRAPKRRRKCGRK